MQPAETCGAAAQNVATNAHERQQAHRLPADKAASKSTGETTSGRISWPGSLVCVRKLMACCTSALYAGNRLALANKESLVAGGPLIREAIEEGGGELIPVDSEHSAIWQTMLGEEPKSVRRVILTASGGPFLGRSPGDLAVRRAHPIGDRVHRPVVVRRAEVAEGEAIDRRQPGRRGVGVVGTAVSLAHRRRA